MPGPSRTPTAGGGGGHGCDGDRQWPGSLLDVARGERPVGFDHVSVGVNASSFHIGYMSIEILRLNYDI